MAWDIQGKDLPCTFLSSPPLSFFKRLWQRVQFRDVDLRVVYIQDAVNKYLVDGGSLLENFHLSVFHHLS